MMLAKRKKWSEHDHVWTCALCTETRLSADAIRAHIREAHRVRVPFDVQAAPEPKPAPADADDAANIEPADGVTEDDDA